MILAVFNYWTVKFYIFVRFTWMNTFMYKLWKTECKSISMSIQDLWIIIRHGVLWVTLWIALFLGEKNLSHSIKSISFESYLKCFQVVYLSIYIGIFIIIL